MRRIGAWIVLPAVGLISLYRFLVSSRLPRVCAFHPSCSEYAQLALRRSGLLEGARQGWRRIRRCRGGLFAGEDWPEGVPLEERTPAPSLGARLVGEAELAGLVAARRSRRDRLQLASSRLSPSGEGPGFRPPPGPDS